MYSSNLRTVVDGYQISWCIIRAKAIELKGFIDDDETHPTLYDKPYYLGPESESAMETYRLFTETLNETGKMAVGEVVLREKESPVLLASYEGGLLMYKLRYPGQMGSMDDVPHVGKEGKVDEEQLEVARELVEKMTKDFVDIDMENHYYRAMQDMIEDKIEGKEIVSTEEEEELEGSDLSAALKESLKSAENGQQYENLTKDELIEALR